MAVNLSGTKAKAKDEEFSMEILEECGTISENGKNRTLLRYISYNGKEPKYDLRQWYEDKNGNEKCGRGLTLTGEELIELYNIIGKLMED